MPEERRRRTPHPKVRTGCGTCKIRRVKCDEQKPECQRCIKSGFKCDGFSHLTQKITSTVDSSGTKEPPCPTISPVLTVRVAGNREERRGLAYFRECTVIDLSGFFYSNFWSRLVLQYGQSEPAIQHALVALSSMHEGLCATSCTLEKEQAELNRRFSLQQYNKSIQILRTSACRDGAHPSKIVLICCLIFFCIESLSGNYKAALTHLQSGIDILLENRKQYWGSFSKAQTEAPKSKPPESIENDLVQMFLQLDIQASSFVDLRQPQLVEPAKNNLQDAQSVPASFSSLHEAKAWLDRITIVLFAFVAFHPTDTQVQAEASAQFQQYEAAVDALQKDTSISMTTKDIQGVMLLKLHLRIARLILVSGLAIATKRPDPFKESTSEFGAVLTLASAIIRNSNSSTSGSDKESATSYTFDLGVVGPLWLAAMQCPDRAMRREAIALLRKSQRREGLWDGALAAEIAEWEIDAEENGRSVAERLKMGGRAGKVSLYKYTQIPA